MAAVGDRCPSRKTKSQEERPRGRVVGRKRGSGRPASAPPDEGKGGDKAVRGVVEDLLARLPPSAELLQHYQNKLAQYEEEEAQLAARIEACARLLDNSSRLEREVALRDSQIERLRQAVEDAGVQIHEGRKRLLRAEAENDRLRIRDVESQHKVAVLSRLCGKSNEEVVLLAEKTTRLPSRCEDGKIGKYEERAQLKNRRSSQELVLEVEHLEQQVVEQEQLHRKQLQEEKKSRKKASKEAEEDKAGLRARITSLQGTVAGLEGNLKMLSSELGAARTSHRKAENTWCGERSVLVRKLQFLEKYGTLEGTHSEHRARERRGGKENPIIVERLEEEGRERQKELDKTRQQLLRAREEVDGEKVRAEAAASVLAKKTKAMQEQVAMLTERSEKLEVRRAREAEGYQAELRQVRSRQQQLEEKLLAITAACQEGKYHEEVVDQLRQELARVDQKKPRQWQD